MLRHGDAGRYDVHELTRQYAGEKLRAAGDADQVREQHLHSFANLAGAAERGLRGSEERTKKSGVPQRCGSPSIVAEPLRYRPTPPTFCALLFMLVSESCEDRGEQLDPGLHRDALWISQRIDGREADSRHRWT